MDFYDKLRLHRCVAILRGLNLSDLAGVVKALHDGGIRLLEITMNTPDAPRLIGHVREHFGDSMIIGAGTVTDLDAARMASEAGARFFITPNLDEDVIQWGGARGIPVIPGVLTPTEIVRARRAGAEMVKIFPASSLGPAYIRELQGPLRHIPMVAVGGVTTDNAAEFIRAGAVAVGVGGSLTDRKAIAERDYGRIRRIASAFTDILGKA